MIASMSELERIVLMYYLNPAAFQMELDYMYLDSTLNATAFLKKIHGIFGGEPPEEIPWLWKEWSKNDRLPWRAKIAQIVEPVASKRFIREYEEYN